MALARETVARRLRKKFEKKKKKKHGCIGARLALVKIDAQCETLCSSWSNKLDSRPLGVRLHCFLLPVPLQSGCGEAGLGSDA